MKMTNKKNTNNTLPIKIDQIGYIHSIDNLKVEIKGFTNKVVELAAVIFINDGYFYPNTKSLKVFNPEEYLINENVLLGGIQISPDIPTSSEGRDFKIEFGSNSVIDGFVIDLPDDNTITTVRVFHEDRLLNIKPGMIAITVCFNPSGLPFKITTIYDLYCNLIP